MPVQTWTPGQILTAAELATVSNMLPYPAVTGSSVSPCAAGTLYRCQPSGGITMTLPPPNAGSTVGFVLDASFGNSVTIAASGGALIYGPGLITGGTSRGLASHALNAPDAVAVLIGDGTNWRVINTATTLQTFSVYTTVVVANLTTTGNAVAFDSTALVSPFPPNVAYTMVVKYYGVAGFSGTSNTGYRLWFGDGPTAGHDITFGAQSTLGQGFAVTGNWYPQSMMGKTQYPSGGPYRWSVNYLLSSSNMYIAGGVETNLIPGLV